MLGIGYYFSFDSVYVCGGVGFGLVDINWGFERFCARRMSFTDARVYVIEGKVYILDLEVYGR